MAGNILGLDINDSFVSGVLLKCGLKTNHIVSCTSISVSEEVGVADAVAKLLEKMAKPNVACVTGIPADLVSFRNLQLPFCNEKNIRKTLPFELENMLPYGGDDIAVDFIIGHTVNGKTDILAASVTGNWLTKRLNLLTESGLTPEAVDVRNIPVVARLMRQNGKLDAGLYLEINQRKCSMILFKARRIVLVRSLNVNLTALNESALQNLGNAIKQTITSLHHGSGIDCSPSKLFIAGSTATKRVLTNFLSDFFKIDVEMVDLCQDDLLSKKNTMTGQWNPATMNNALALALRDNRQVGFNFNQGNFAIRKQLARFKKELIAGIVYTVIFLIILAMDAIIDRSQLTKQMAALDNQVKVIFSQTFPDAKRIVRPVRQMRIKMIEMRKGSGSGMPGMISSIKVIDLLSDISKRIPAKLALQINRMVVDQEAIVLKGKTDTFNTVDNIKKGLSASPYYEKVTIASANLARSGNGVQFELKLDRVGNSKN